MISNLEKEITFKLELLDIIENDDKTYYKLRMDDPKMMSKELIKQQIDASFNSKNEIILEASMFNNSPDLNRILNSFPLDNKTKGYVSNDLMNYFSMKEKEPFIIKDGLKDELSRRSGLYRVGIKQDNNSFLRCIVSFIYGFKLGDLLNDFINNIEKDLFLLQDNIRYIAKGNFITCFSSKDLFNDKYNIYDLFEENKDFIGYSKRIKDILVKNRDNERTTENNFSGHCQKIRPRSVE